MTFRCTSFCTVQPATAKLVHEIVPYPSEYGDVPLDSPYQCELEGTPHGIHAAYLRDIPGDVREVYFCWASDEDCQYVMVQDVCLKRMEEGSETCELPLRHPGVCHWAYVDPKVLALTAEMDQALAYLSQYGHFPVTPE